MKVLGIQESDRRLREVPGDPLTCRGTLRNMGKND
nr:MAG TPA: hypothetical protein [Caudoviricetes sp.]